MKFSTLRHTGKLAMKTRTTSYYLINFVPIGFANEDNEPLLFRKQGELDQFSHSIGREMSDMQSVR